MGFLHEGHLSLVDLAMEKVDFVAVSIFVNPLQFGPGEDLARYPRDLEGDVRRLEDRGVELTFVPTVEAMYPGGEPQVTVDPGPMGRRLCGAYRPGHFRGVLTVVARLFGLFRPHLAAFGQKDFQQSVLIRKMVQDLEMGVDIVVGPIVREADGLALSSRNVYLSPAEREQAVGLNRALETVQDAFRRGVRTGSDLRELLRDQVGRHELLKLQYGEIVDPETLVPLEEAGPGAAAVVAAFCGGTRLIDNLLLDL
jgi:pantoate--beta-alanine ligase